MDLLWIVAAGAVIITVISLIRPKTEKFVILDQATAQARLKSYYFKPRKQINADRLANLERVAGVLTDQELLRIVGERRLYDDIQDELEYVGNNGRLPLWVVRHMFGNTKTSFDERITTLRTKLKERHA